MTPARLLRIGGAGALLGAVVAAGVMAVQSQEAADPGRQKQAIPWTSTCTSPGRGLAAECALQQRAILNKTRRVIGMITIRVPSETKRPVMMIQTPLGLFLPAGVDVDVDGDMAQNYPFQSCNGNGCYVGFPIPDKLLARMFKGGRLNVSFQYVSRKRLTLPMSLVGFSEAYDRIK
ncbi:MAG: invasion associated locus B family protein [Parvibaculaceae bacterium]